LACFTLDRSIIPVQPDYGLVKKPKHVAVIKFSFYSPTDVQVDCLKNNLKMHIKINIKTAPTCFGAGTPSSGSALHYALPDDGVPAPKHVGAVLMLILM